MNIDKISLEERPTMYDSTMYLETKLPMPRLANITSYINFPPLRNIAIYRNKVEGFGKVVSDIFSDAVGRKNVESLLEEVTDAEIGAIREADTFRKASSSLFRSLVKCITCEAEHFARLHLSGFCTGQLEMLLGTSEHDWMPASFTQKCVPFSAPALS